MPVYTIDGHRLEAVIKPLRKVFERLRSLAGSTILKTEDTAPISGVSELAAIAHTAGAHARECQM
ncbi:hypothetical protein [Thiorhodococcus fuscus]|uniref:Uncharacterized protein n=1 Tax=Thiorhodococcus fuscus TaxID=527200 RepID=A0ABW4YCF6_9GAMM